LYKYLHSTLFYWAVDGSQAWFYVGAEGGGEIAAPKKVSFPPPPNLWLQQQYVVAKPANSYTYTGGVFGWLEWLIW